MKKSNFNWKVYFYNTYKQVWEAYNLYGLVSYYMTDLQSNWKKIKTIRSIKPEEIQNVE